MSQSPFPGGWPSGYSFLPPYASSSQPIPQSIPQPQSPRRPDIVIEAAKPSSLASDPFWRVLVSLVIAFAMVLTIFAVYRLTDTGGHPPTPPAPSVNPLTVGKEYAPLIVLTYADAWDVAATAMENGKSVADTEKVLQETWVAGRTRAFHDKVEPILAATLPPGTEPADPAKRAAIAAEWRDFAKGLRKGVGR